jgi:probable DNA repair protein
MAREAHELLCSYAPPSLASVTRSGWQGDAEVFSEWLTEFDTRCSASGLLSTARLPLEMLSYLQNDATERVPLLLAGFDRMRPTQSAFLKCWGKWDLEKNDRPIAAATYYKTPDAATELAACAIWCRQHLEKDPDARLLVVSQDAALRRGEIERSFHRYLGQTNTAASPLEFSLGIPLADVPLIRGALLLLRWFTQPISENELDWLLSTELTAETSSDTAALQRYMQDIRRRNQQRPVWTLEAFLNAQPGGSTTPDSWSHRMLNASRLLQQAEKQPALAWAELVPRLMKEAGWPGQNPMASASFQALEHWSRVVEECGTIGFDEKNLGWPVFHSSLARQLDNSLFTPESQGANIVITGAVQSGGMSADAIWFLGAEEDAWPLNGPTHPFLPYFLQRESGMPHSSIQLDCELSEIVTSRLMHSAPEVCFSHAAFSTKAEANPSRMAIQFAGAPIPLPAELIAVPSPSPSTETFEDESRVQYASTKAVGGSSTLTLQSQCAFKAFATTRLGARSWDAAEIGLNPRQKGELAHAVLHAVWGGSATNGWRTSDELVSMLNVEGPSGLEKFVTEHVRTVLQLKLSSKLRDRLSVRYLLIEEKRLVRLVVEWLLLESSRARFVVEKVEEKTTVTIAGLELDVRLDRLDTLEDGTSLVVDYKTGQAAASQWDLPRPDDVQLPIYSAFAVENASCGGLVFGSLRTGEVQFAGKVRQSVALLPNLSGKSPLVKYPLAEEHLEDWRSAIEQLARDYLAGAANVNPRHPSSTCEHCSLRSLCRIEDSRSAQGDSAAEDAIGNVH